MWLWDGQSLAQMRQALVLFFGMVLRCMVLDMVLCLVSLFSEQFPFLAFVLLFGDEAFLHHLSVPAEFVGGFFRLLCFFGCLFCGLGSFGGFVCVRGFVLGVVFVQETEEAVKGLRDLLLHGLGGGVFRRSCFRFAFLFRFRVLLFPRFFFRKVVDNATELFALFPGAAFRGPDGHQRMGGLAEDHELQGLVPGAAGDHLPVILRLLQEGVNVAIGDNALVPARQAHADFLGFPGGAVTQDRGPVRGELAAAHPVIEGNLQGYGQEAAQLQGAAQDIGGTAQYGPAHGQVQGMLAGDMAAFMGQDRGNQFIRNGVQEAGGQDDEGRRIPIGIGIRVHIHLQVQVRHRDAQLFADGRKHVIILPHLVFAQLDAGGHVQDLSLALVPDVHEAFDEQGKARDSLQGLQGGFVGFVGISFRIK